MGTRADFYLGFGEGSEWLGSVAWDGYQWAEGESNALMDSQTPDEFRQAVKEIQAIRDDFTTPEMGWPWPWSDSRTTDYAYCLEDDGEFVSVVPYIFGSPIADTEDDEERESLPKREGWPDMTDVQNVTLGGRSGVMFISA